MEAIEEGGLAPGYEISAYERGRGAPFSKPVKLGAAQSDLEQLLNMIQLNPKVPKEIKDFATDILIPKRTPTAQLPEVPASAITPLDDVTAKMDASELPTPKFTPAQMAASRAPTVKLDNLPSPQAFGGPTKGRKPAPQMSKPGFFGKLKKAVGLEEQKQIESLVMQVLEEMAKKQKPAKETKKEPKKAGKK